MSASLRVLLVGAGRVAERHAAAIAGAGDRVVAVVDPDPARREHVAHGAHGYGRLAEALAGGVALDAAVVASPSRLHLEQAEALAAAGLPVLVEKPHRLPGQDPAPLRALVAGGAHVQVGLMSRYAAAVREIRDAVRAGELGELLAITERTWFQLHPDSLAPWYFDPAQSGGGVIATNGVHSLDRACWMLDGTLEVQDVRRASISPAAREHGVEDAATLRLRGPAGEPMTLSLLWAPYAVGGWELRIAGTRGAALATAEYAWEISTVDGVRRGPAESEDSLFASQWGGFRAALAGDGAPGPTLAEAERALEAMEAAYAWLEREGARTRTTEGAPAWAS